MPHAKRKKSKKNSTPKSKAALVTENWDRVFSDEGYQAAVVKVKSRKGSVLAFQLVDKQGVVAPTVHKVDLDDGAVVWGELPSTAQLVKNSDRARHALLYLALGWAQKTGVVPYGGPNGGKWPKTLSL